jgi:hypothetical protein
MVESPEGVPPSGTGAGRRVGRVRLTVPCEIKGVQGKASTRDLSVDGCVLSSPERSTVGDKLDLTLRLPGKIEIQAEVRWVKADPAKDLFSLGCRFVHSDASQRSLKEMLKKMASSIDNAARGVK